MATPISTLTANGSTEWVRKGTAYDDQFVTLYATGTFGGGTVKAQVCVTDKGVNPNVTPPTNEEIFDVPDTSLTAKGFVNVSANAWWTRATLISATSPEIKIFII